MSATNLFISPPPANGTDGYSHDTSCIVGTVGQIVWSTDFSIYGILMHQQDPVGDSHNGDQQITFVTNNTATSGEQISFTWTCQTYEWNLTFSNIFYFQLVDLSNNDSPPFYSHYFNITQPAGQSLSSTSIASTTSTSTSTSTTTSSRISTTLKTSASATKNSPTTGAALTPSGPSGSRTAIPSSSIAAASNTSTPILAEARLSSGAKAGIGVGAAIGVLLAIALAALIGYSVARRRAERRDAYRHSQRWSGGTAYSPQTASTEMGYAKAEAGPGQDDGSAGIGAGAGAGRDSDQHSRAFSPDRGHEHSPARAFSPDQMHGNSPSRAFSSDHMHGHTRAYSADHVRSDDSYASDQVEIHELDTDRPINELTGLSSQ